MNVGESIAVIVYNPIGRSRTKNIELPVPSSSNSYAVVDSTLTSVSSQIVRNLNFVQVDSQPFSLFFEVSLPAMGYATYIVTLQSDNNNNKNDKNDDVELPIFATMNEKKNEKKIKNENVKVSIDSELVYETDGIDLHPDDQFSLFLIYIYILFLYLYLSYLHLLNSKLK